MKFLLFASLFLLLATASIEAEDSICLSDRCGRWVGDIRGVYKTLAACKAACLADDNCRLFEIIFLPYNSSQTNIQIYVP